MRFALPLALILLLSCTGCRKSILIPEKDMEVILTKVFLTDALILSPHFGRTLYNQDTIEYYSYIYESMGYTKTQFDSTLSYYAHNPNILNRVMDKVVSSLSQMESEANIRAKAPKEKEEVNIETDSTSNGSTQSQPPIKRSTKKKTD